MKQMLVMTFTIMALCQPSAAQSDFPILRGEYLGQKPPGIEPELFAPGIITTELHDDGPPVFTPDGSEVYFRIAGRPSSKIFRMSLEDGKWSPPVVDPVAEKCHFQFSAFSHDGQRRYFSSKIGPDGVEKEDSDILYIEKTTGGWSSPVRVEGALNTEYDEQIFCVAEDGTIFFGAEYPGGKGKMDIYRSRLVGGIYTAPENLEAVNTASVETVAAVGPEQEYMIFTSTRVPATSGINLWIAFRTDDDSWTEPVNMGEKINDRMTDKFPGISPDGKYIFWVSHREHKDVNPTRVWAIKGVTMPEVSFEGADIYWVSTKIVEEFRPEDR